MANKAKQNGNAECEKGEAKTAPHIRLDFRLQLFRVDDSGNITHAAGCEETKDGPGVRQWFKFKPAKCNNHDSANVGVWDFDSCPDDVKAAVRHNVAQFEKMWTRMWDWDETKEDLPIDPECAAEIINPNACAPFRTDWGGMMGWFIRDLLQYPRFVDDAGCVYLGGMRFIDAKSDKAKKGSKVSVDDMLEEVKRDRGPFDRCVGGMKSYIGWIGRNCGCVGAAVKVHSKLGLIVDWLENETRLADAAFDELWLRVDALYAALEEMAIAVASSKPKKKNGGRSKGSGLPARCKSGTGDFILRAAAHIWKPYIYEMEPKDDEWCARIIDNANKRGLFPNSANDAIKAIFLSPGECRDFILDGADWYDDNARRKRINTWAQYLRNYDAEKTRGKTQN